IMTKLRNLAHPEWATEGSGFAGSAGNTARPDNDRPVARTNQPEHLAYQTGLTSLGGVNLALRASVTADQRSVRWTATPVFNPAAGADDTPMVVLPLIPGAPDTVR